MIKIVATLTIIMNKEKQPSEMQKRLFALCDALGMSRRQFSKSVGQSAAYLGNLKDDITVGVLNNILATYPQVNMVWLVKGEGEMFIQEPLKEDLSSYIMQENKELKKENKELYAEVVLLRNQIKRMEDNYGRVDIAADNDLPTYFRTFKNYDADKKEE